MITKKTLDADPVEFRRMLEESIELVLNQFTGFEERKAYHYHPQEAMESLFSEDLPAKGIPFEQLLSEVKEKVMDTATDNMGHHMYAYVMAGGNQVAIIAEMLAATINQNIGKWHLAPGISEIEKRVVQWASQMIGFGDKAGGVLVSGGSAANLSGLTIARNIYFHDLDIRKKGLFNQKPFTVYASKEVHGCVDKSLEQLGIGTDHLRKIETGPDFRINTGKLREAIEADLNAGFQPFCVVGNAGTVNTGAIDDLDALSSIAKEYELWFHIDGAYGGLAASLDTLSSQYNGLEKADSVAIDFHKWLYQPFEVGCVLVKDWNTLRRAYFKKADYLDTTLEGDNKRLDFNEHTFQLSRNAKALKVWMSLKAYGMNAIREMIQKDISLTHYLSDTLEASDDFELKSRSHLAVNCFRYTAGLTDSKEIDRLNKALIPALEKDERVFITGTRLNGEFVLRACIINHRKQKESVDYLINVIRETGQKLLN